MRSTCTRSIPASASASWLQDLEADFLEVFGDDSLDSRTAVCRDEPETSSTDPFLDEMTADLKELFGELSLSTQKARQHSLSLSELVSHLQQAIDLIGVLKRQNKPNPTPSADMGSADMRSHIADLQHLVGEINTLLAHLSQIKGA